MISSDQRPPGEDWLVRRIVDLERQVRELQAGRRLEAASIGAGGLTVKNGGQIVVQDPADGKGIIQLGRVLFADGSTKPGMVVFRTNADGGRVALSLFDGVPAIWDRSSQVVATDEASGQGLARPYLPAAHFGISFNAELFSQIPGTVSASFTGVLETRTPATHPRLKLQAFVGGDTGGTTAEGRITVNGTSVITSGGDGWINGTVAVPGWADTVGFLEEIDIRLEVRRTAGTGRALGQVYACYGVQS